MPSEIQEALERARRLWRVVFCAPLLYASFAWVIDTLLFRPRLRTGLLDTTTYETQVAVVAAGALLLLVLQPTIYWLRGRLARRLRDLLAVRDGEFQAAAALYRGAVRLIFAADAAALLGLTFFLATGSWRALILGIGAAYLFYFQVFPSRRLLPMNLPTPEE